MSGSRARRARRAARTQGADQAARVAMAVTQARIGSDDQYDLTHGLTAFTLRYEDERGRGACGFRWGPLEWVTPTDVIRAVAEDMFTAAAYADMLMMLLKTGTPPERVFAFATDLITHGLGRNLGHPDFVTIIPCGSSRDRQVAVRIQRGKQRMYARPHEAREEARNWLELAGAAEADTMLGEVLKQCQFDADQIEAVFAYMQFLRNPDAVIADLTPPEQPSPGGEDPAL